ncbi:MAG TPA: 30S ribosomal protein S5 [Candidatus Kaiserbacteria bacterium]|nr:30S ribosomal protein S5 [Candidatus Kaiserbacteria bacterium]
MTTTTDTTQKKKIETEEVAPIVIEEGAEDSDRSEGVTEVVAASDAVSAVAISGVTGGAQAPSTAENPAKRARSARARRPRTGRGERPRSEFDQMTIDVRRVARVVAGGRRFSFSVTVVIGDHKGRVGVGIGKGTDTALAIEKATRNARRHVIRVPLTASHSILHEVSTKYTSSYITIAPSPGRGIVAGSAMRIVIELSGVTDVVGKILSRSKNKLTIARATVQALSTVGKGRTQVIKSEDSAELAKSSHKAQSVVS